MDSDMRAGGRQIEVHGGPDYDDPESWPDERAAAERFATREIVEGEGSSAPWRVVGLSAAGELLVATHVSGTEYGPVLLGAAVDVKRGMVTDTDMYVDLALDEGDEFDAVRQEEIAPDVVERAVELAKSAVDS